MRLVRGDTAVFAEVAENASLTAQSAAVVAAGTVLTAIGSGMPLERGPVVWEAIGFLVLVSLAVWLAYGFVVFLLARIWMRRGRLGPILRVLGFASAPRAIVVLGLVPWLSFHVAVVAFLGTVWLMLTGLAVALRTDTGATTLLVFLAAVVCAFALIAGTLAYGALMGYM